VASFELISELFCLHTLGEYMGHFSLFRFIWGLEEICLISDCRLLTAWTNNKLEFHTELECHVPVRP
jgi:hypothetical protein